MILFLLPTAPNTERTVSLKHFHPLVGLGLKKCPRHKSQPKNPILERFQGKRKIDYRLETGRKM